MKKNYDYIVIGAGSAGSVMADRLSASGEHSVLVIEAGGPDRNIWIHIPLGYGRTFFNRTVNWMFETEPQAGLNGRRIAQPRGKGLGGSSSINGLLYVRGQREDYDGWRDLGNRGWGYSDVLPMFKRSEDQQRGSGPWHGAGGPLPVTDLPEKHPIAEAFIAAGVKAGIPYNSDFNGERQEGVGPFQATAKRGLRYSTAKAFLRRALKRPNLDLVTHAQVTRILFDGVRARGVAFVHEGANVEVTANREILLCAGAIQSPHILQLSGVGPEGLLRQYGIPVVKALPGVGENLQDHVQARFILETKKKITLNDDMANPFRQLWMGVKYIFTRKGPLGWWAGIAGGFIKTRPDLDRPDVQFHVYPFSTDRKDRPVLHPYSAFTLTVCQLRPYSRGHVRLKSADPMVPPAISPNYLSDPRDADVLAAGMKIARRVAAAEPLASMIESEKEPGPSLRDEELLSFLRAKAMSVYHPVGTCRMGNDENAVVDDQLRVHGLVGLRVVDASIMPTLISGNTNAPSIMIGEMGAEFVLRTATLQNSKAA
ncbi:GMC family oxidoreductase [Bradyrhizobium sp. SYSU BS000235]|uniref:GMC family oxidoreductase n=1 Tax=Bradyrhizobium sp. SYSU BS000235 TaxID=3411332 RepID=UPI003C715F95